jgi:hypothetical protein
MGNASPPPFSIPKETGGTVASFDGVLSTLLANDKLVAHHRIVEIGLMWHADHTR